MTPHTLLLVQCHIHKYYTLVICFVDYLILLMFVHPLRHSHVDTHYCLCSITCTYTTLPPPCTPMCIPPIPTLPPPCTPMCIPPIPTPTPHSQLLNPLKLLCVHGGAVVSRLVCNGCSRRCTVCTNAVSGREWCEVRRRSTVRCTRVWCGVWVVWCAAVLVAGE